MKAITVSVDYGDFLAITLPRNAPRFERVVVVTAPGDKETLEVVKRVPNAIAYQTDAFYRQGAKFNKGLAMEEGLDVLGRDGWLCIWDADTLFPDGVDMCPQEVGYIYTPKRRMVLDPAKEMVKVLSGAWGGFPFVPDGEPAGFCQIFHAADPALQCRPWYGTDWTHAGGCDSDFWAHWGLSKWRKPPYVVLHLGVHGKNWCGRATPKLDGTVLREAAERAEAQSRLIRERRAHPEMQRIR